MASLTSYETGSGRRYCVRWREGSKHRGRSFIRKRDAEQFRADVIRRHQLGELWQEDGDTFGEYLDSWLDRYGLRVRESSARRRRHALRAFPERVRSVPLASVSAAEVEDAVTAIALRAPRQGELALASLKLALKDAAKRSLKFDRRIFDLTSPRSNGRPARFLTWQEVQKLAEWLPDRHARLVMVAALSGLRRGEMMALKWGDIDLEHGTLKVREGKTEAARRSVDLPGTAVELLREQAAALGEGGRAGTSEQITPRVPAGHGELRPLVPPSPSAPVFPNNRGGHMDGHNFLNRWFLPATRATGLDGVTFHSLRHTYASLLAAANVNPKVAAGLLGHADGGALFLRRYSHLYSGAGRSAADALEASL